MLNQTQAKQKFRTTLAVLLVSIIWPVIGLVLFPILALAGVKNMGVGVLLYLIVWLALFIWLLIQCWRLAPEVGVTPWASLWLLFPFFGTLIISMLFLEPLKYLADGKPENKRLPQTWDLVKQTWKLYTETFKDSAKVSLYFIYVSIVSGIIAALAVYFGMAYELVSLIMVLPLALANAWVTVLIFHRVASLEAGQTSYQPLKESWRNWLSYLWLAIEIIVFSAGPFILAALIIAVVSLVVGQYQNLGALFIPGVKPVTAAPAAWTYILTAILGIVLLIPTWIWLIYKSAVWNSFALPILMIDGKKGKEDLKEATRIAKGRWWGLFWKNQLGGICFGAYGMLIGLGISIAILILGAIFKALNLGQSVDIFLSQLADGVIAMILIPLFMGFTVKLYRAFKKTS
jgi:phage shock protein PspC (stress-responsive transcriptional regulator)